METTEKNRKIGAREVALSVLEKTGGSVPVQPLLDACLREVELSRQNAALATELVYGVLRSEIRLRWILSRFLKDPGKLPPLCLRILTLALYEMLFLVRIPTHATVNTYVDAVRRRFGPGLARVANGVLRTIARKMEIPGESPLSESYYEQAGATPEQRLSIRYSLPIWITSLWIRDFGWEKAAELAGAMCCTPRACIRVNRMRSGWESLRNTLLEKGQSVGEAGVLFSRMTAPVADLHELAVEGKISYHGAGSQKLLAALLAEKWDGSIWDACAGRGGKTLSLIEMEQSVLLASDINLRRLRGLRQDADRLGLKAPATACMSASAPALCCSSKFKNILLDVPCSGLGTLARHPDMRILRTPDQLPELTVLQKDILHAAWNHLESGGRLFYMTCTVNPDENERQIRSFLRNHLRAELEREYANDPDIYGTDLMYGAVIRKTGV
ncbi:MAG: transcription antitermination factor NusB [Desulfovibrionaceae bacterium]|nr:transcription antitermination factor NusB [Desulfovibrionaceae bacterium]